MIRLSRMADYAVMLLAQISTRDLPVISAQQLSESTGLALPTTSKILKILVRQNILLSSRGMNGGYRLARPASEISVASIISAVDGPIALTECADGGHEETCSFRSLCASRHAWRHINAIITRSLESLSLQELLSPVPPYALFPPTASVAGDIKEQGVRP